MASGLELLRVGGRAVWVGAVRTTPPVSVDPEQVVRRLLSVIGVHNYRPPDLVEAVSFLTRTHESRPFADLVQDVFPLEKATEALERAATSSAPRLAVLSG